MFTQAIVRKPCRALTQGLTSVDLGVPDFDRAAEQHDEYRTALIDCGLQLVVLEADEQYPDSVFVEDVALCLPDCAVLTNPGAPSRQGEVDEMRGVLASYYDELHHITAPGTLDAGDVLEVEDHYYIGLSERTNQLGVDQLIQILNVYGATGSAVSFDGFLHLKSGISWLGEDTLLLAKEFETLPAFADFEKLIVPANESYAANAILVNEKIFLAQGYPETLELLSEAGYEVITLDMSEFMKIDGGLSCLSLRS